jgi:hypothetical protein
MIEMVNSNSYASRYNVGIDALMNEDFSTAREAFTGVASDADDPDLRKEARARLVDIDFAEGIEEAIGQINKGHRTAAKNTLDRLATLPLSAEQRKYLDELRSAL